MSIKIIPLVKAFPESDYGSNKTKSYMFAHAGADYWRASEIIKKENKGSGTLMTFYVELPLMHMALELMLKAIIAFNDDNFIAKNHKHMTSILITNYSDKIEILKNIQNDSEKMKLIKSLENSWESIRYAECAFSYNGDDIKLFDEIMSELYDEYSRLSGLKFL